MFCQIRRIKKTLCAVAKKCAAEMKQLGELPALSIHAAIKVFRCYTCDHAVTDRVL